MRKEVLNMLHENKEILDSAVASVEMEGYKLTEEEKKLCYDYVNDTITKTEFIKTILERCAI